MTGFIPHRSQILLSICMPGCTAFACLPLASCHSVVSCASCGRVLPCDRALYATADNRCQQTVHVAASTELWSHFCWWDLMRGSCPLGGLPLKGICRDSRLHFTPKGEHSFCGCCQVAEVGSRQRMGSFSDRGLSSGLFLGHLLAAVQPAALDVGLLTPGDTPRDRELNAKYVISTARKLGCFLFLVPAPASTLSYAACFVI